MEAATGRRILSTHFHHPLRAALAFDAALATTDSIAWVPSLEGEYSQNDGDDSNEEGGEREAAQAWTTTSRRAGGQAVCQVERNGLRYIAPIAAEGESESAATPQPSTDRWLGPQSIPCCRWRSSLSCMRFWRAMLVVL